MVEKIKNLDKETKIFIQNISDTKKYITDTEKEIQNKKNQNNSLINEKYKIINQIESAKKKIEILKTKINKYEHFSSGLLDNVDDFMKSLK